MSCNRLHQDGYNEGFKIGTNIGLSHGREAGRQKASQIGWEIGFYRGCVKAWMTVIKTEEDIEGRDRYLMFGGILITLLSFYQCRNMLPWLLLVLHPSLQSFFALHTDLQWYTINSKFIHYQAIKVGVCNMTSS